MTLYLIAGIMMGMGFAILIDPTRFEVHDNACRYTTHFAFFTLDPLNRTIKFVVNDIVIAGIGDTTTSITRRCIEILWIIVTSGLSIERCLPRSWGLIGKRTGHPRSAGATG